MSVEGWKTGKLRDITVINYGKSPVKILSPEGQYPVVGTGETERLGTNFLYDGESIILGRKGSIDRVYFASGKFWAIDTAYYLSDFRETFPRWLFYYLQTIDLRQMNEATGVPSLSREFLYNIALQIPAKAEQTQIATILSTIDRAIEQTEALIAKQQRIKTGLMQDLLTKGIDENGNIRSEETHKFKDSPLGRIPVEWEVVTTGQVTKSLVPGRDKPDLDGGGVPWITIPDIEGMYLDLPKSGLSLSLNAIKVANARLMPKGTVLMSCVGEFGIATITECDAVANQQLHGFICDQSILPEWLIAQINASGNRIDNMATQTTIKYLNKNGCESILITLPSLKEQVKIISILDNINDLFEKQKKSLNKLRSLKTGLMQDLLTGKVRVTDLLNQNTATN
jgi:type I restriction enzyme S subunit